MPQAIHFISIGGSVMHNLAIALQQQGHTITGSDDELYEPSRTRLQQHGLLPATMGWFSEKIHLDIQVVILGMHARKDNPELIRAQALGLPVYSYPDYIYQQSQQKQRVVIAGSHGKTTITSMILHVLKHHNRRFDYVVGAQVDGFETTVQLTPDHDGLAAPVIIIEGDEYASSPIDPRAKFLLYQPHMALISGIAWDHVNIYPTWDEYVDQFESLAEAMPKAGILTFDDSDDMLDVIGQKERDDITKIPYQAHPSEIVDGQTYLLTKQKARIPIRLFGEHNMKNIAGAMTICDRIGLTEDQFYAAIPTFKGVAGRLEKVTENGNRILLRDFAQAPFQVEATTEAVKRQYPNRKLLAVVELHTLSSLNKTFLEQYRGSLDAADAAVVYFNEHTLAAKQLEPISPDDVITAFGRSNMPILTNTADLQAYLIQQRETAEIFLFMSSGTFGGLNLAIIANELI